MIVTIAAGSTIKKFCLNLSFILQPCVLTAAIVVSEIKERLSPNMAPHTTAPTQIETGKLVCCDTPSAIGASAVMVPMEVPMEMDIKQPIIKRPTTINCGGMMESPRFTVLSTPPAAVTIPENAPATRKISTMVMMFTSPAPLATISSLSLKESFLFCRNPMNRAIRKATYAGML